MSDIDAALERLLREMRKPVVADLAGRKVLMVPNATGSYGVQEWGPEAPIEALQFGTLDSFVDYAKLQDPTTEEALTIHVGPTWVELLGEREASGAKRIPCYARATVSNFGAGEEDGALRYGTFYDPETFNIWLLTHFADTPNRAKVMQVVGTLREEKVQTVADDGVSQTAQVRAGIVLGTEQRVPNPVDLTPRRTFREVAQPPSPFVLRLRGGGDGKQPSCALFEADGGAWKLEAIDAIVKEVKARLGDVAIPVLG